MKQLLYLLFAFTLFACNNDKTAKSQNKAANEAPAGSGLAGKWEGSFTNGMNETFISFEISEDGKELRELTFKGYWRCDGKLEHTTLGPEKSFMVRGNKVEGTITEPEDGGASAIRYELQAEFKGGQAEGMFRMNINALACDTYKLNWTAKRK